MKKNYPYNLIDDIFSGDSSKLNLKSESELREIIKNFVSKMNDNQKLLLDCVYVRKMTYKQIHEEMGISSSTIRNNKLKILRNFRMPQKVSEFVNHSSDEESIHFDTKFEEDFLNLKLKDLKFTNKTLNVLKRNKILYVHELISLKFEDTSKLKLAGPNVIEEIKPYLKNNL